MPSNGSRGPVFNKSQVSSLVAFLVLGASACGVESEVTHHAENEAAHEQEPACFPSKVTAVDKSLVVTDPEVLKHFSFERTMRQVITTAGAAVTPSTAFSEWMRDFGNGPGGCLNAGIDPNGYGLVCPRAEAELSTVDPFSPNASTTFKPVALFNRFDLAPTSGAHCGEYRIVYAMTSSTLGRMFIIFEATLSNPKPAAGLLGCLGVAQFWQGLSADTSVTSRASKLVNFYYNGTAVQGASAVVKAINYGLKDTGLPSRGTGQIRTNGFVRRAEWNLSEFKLRRTCPIGANACTLFFDRVVVRNNPANELFTGAHEKSVDFQTRFLTKVAGLASTSVTGIALGTATGFDEFESVSQRTDVNYSLFTSSKFRTNIQAKLTALGSKLSPTNILDRATTQTCAGCHQNSVGQALGDGLTWPGTLGFVHVDEESRLSPALTTVFLPQRVKVLESFIGTACVARSALVDNGLNIGGQQVDSAN